MLWELMEAVPVAKREEEQSGFEEGLAFCSSKEAHCKLIISSEMYKKAYIIVENAQDTYIA